MWIGLGWDLHRLVPGRPLVLAGVKIPFHLGLQGHSDADVLTHAVMDALLGAAGLDDIGAHFPDHDPEFRNAYSLDLLQRVVSMVGERGYRPRQVDAVVLAQKPRLSAYRSEMRANLARVMAVKESRVGVKATTTEGLGAIGSGEAMAAQAVALLEE